jgi:heptosyltransferase-2
MSSRHNRILVVRTDRIGDVVLSTPLIRALRKALPSSFIAAMVSPYARDVLVRNPHLNELFVDDAGGEHAGAAGFWKQVRTLNNRRFDTALILLPKSRLSWMMFFGGIRTRVSVETRLDHVLTFTKTVSRNKYVPLRHVSDYCLDLARKLK